jgi:putative oxidoreductase
MVAADCNLRPVTGASLLFERSKGVEAVVDLSEIRADWTPRMLSVFRIVLALLFLQHPLAKFVSFPHVAMFDNLQSFSLIWFAGVIELIGSVLVLVGLFTRPAAFILAGEMAVAYFMVRAPRNFFPLLNGGEVDVLFCFGFLYLAFAGAGPWSVDAR